MTVKERLSRMEGILNGAWWSLSNLSRGLPCPASNETVMRIVAEAMADVRAMQALGVEVLNVDCEDPPRKGRNR